MDLYNASTDFEEESDLALSPEEYEERVADLQKVIETAEMAKELQNDPKYVAIVTQGFFEDSKARLVGLLTTGGIPKQVCDGAADDLRGMGVFNSYMRDILQMGDNAKVELASLEEAWNEFIETQESTDAQS